MNLKNKIKLILSAINQNNSFVEKLKKSLNQKEILHLTDKNENEIDSKNLKEILLKAFNKKPSRVLEIIILQYKHDLTFPLDVLRAMKEISSKVGGDIRNKEPEMVKKLLIELSEMGKLKQGIKLMKSVGLLEGTLPEIHKYIETEQSGPYHLEGDVFKHTMMVLDHVEAKTVEAQISALLHDIAKPATMALINDRITFHGHEDLGEEMVEAMLTQLGFEKNLINKIKKITVNHLRPHQLSAKPTPKSIKKFIEDMGDELKDVLELAHADGLGRIPSKSGVPELKKKIEEVLDMEKEEIEKKQKEKEDHPVSGNDVIDLLDLKGPEIGRAMNIVRDIEKDLKEKEGEVIKEKVLKILKEKFIKKSSASEKEVEKLIQKIIPKTKFDGKVFSVGGFVRDEIIGIPSKDLDVLVEMKGGAEDLTKLIHDTFKDETTKPLDLGKGYPIWKINFKEDIKFKDEIFKTKGAELEVADTQKESFPDPSTRQRKTEPGTLQEDIERRDFTVNMLLRDLTSGEIKDLTGTSRKDIEKGILKGYPEGNMSTKFSEDPLRMLRLIRFMAKYNWDVPYQIIKDVKNNADRIKILSSEKIKEEIDKIMMVGKLSKAVKFMSVTGILKHIIPELNKDIVKLTVEVLSKSKPGVEKQLSALLSEIDPDEQLASKAAEDILKRLRYDNEMINKVKKTILNKNKAQEAKNYDTKELRKFIRDVGNELEYIIDLAEAKGDKKDFDNLKDRIKEVLKVPVNQRSILNGKDIMEIFNVKGKDIQKYLSKAIEIEDQLVSDGKSVTKEKVIEELKKEYKS